MSTNVSMQSVVVTAQGQVSCDLEGETAILGLDQGIYYGLDRIGARVWNLLQQPRSVEEICNALLQEYEVEPERCRNDLLALLECLRVEGLIEVQAGPAAQPAGNGCQS
jgi:Coenzyme PQQ synthesis protein D (PqqD)